MSEYAQRAQRRWVEGVALIRGGDHKPFVGDPVAEGIEEALDLQNYADEARRQKRLGAIKHSGVVLCAWIAFRILRSAQS